jgi:hypothetical protein
MKKHLKIFSIMAGVIDTGYLFVKILYVPHAWYTLGPRGNGFMTKT